MSVKINQKIENVVAKAISLWIKALVHHLTDIQARCRFHGETQGA